MQDPKTFTRWMAFRLTPRTSGSVEKDPTNVNIGVGKKASCDDPATWATYEDARAFVAAHPDHCLGFVLGKEVGLCVVDIDKARASKDTPWPEWVDKEVEELDSFTETSVSGLGLHVWVWGSIPANRHNRDRGVEIHDSNKMFCVSPEFAEEWEKIQERELAELWRRIDQGRIGPDYRKPILAYAHNDAKFRALCEGNIAPYFTSRSEAVASVLATLANKHKCDTESMRAEFERTELCKLWADKWDRLGDRELVRAVKWYEEKQKKSPIAELPPFRHSAITRPKRTHVLRPKDKFDGWFPTSSVSVVGGPSGGGKTSVLLALLHAQVQGKQYLGHEGGGLPFIILYADRGSADNDETLERLGLQDAGLVTECLPLVWDTEAIIAVMEFIEQRPTIPGVVLIEGGDMLPTDASDLRTVATMVRRFQEIAAHYSLALIMSVGAPKATKESRHVLMRDRIFGSQIWGRMASTIATASIPADDDGTGDERLFDVLHRNAAAEHFNLQFVNGQLVLQAPKVELDTFEIWASTEAGLEEKGWFTVAEAQGAMEARGSALSKTEVKKRIIALKKFSKLEKQYRGDPKKEMYRWVFPMGANAPEEVLSGVSAQ